MSRPAREKLTGKQKQAAYLYAIETKTQRDIASEVGVSEQTMCKWVKDPRFMNEVDRLLREEWRDSCRELQKIMISKGRKGDFRALEYVLSSNGYKAPDQVIIDSDTIRVSIEDDEFEVE